MFQARCLIHKLLKPVNLQIVRHASKVSQQDLLPRLQKMHNGKKVKPTFSAKEMQSRLDKLRHIMVKKEVGACIFTSYHNVNYFSDYLYCQFGRPYALIVTMDKAISISAGIDGGQPYRRTFGDNITYTDWHRDNFFYAVQQEVGDLGGSVGIEFDHVPMVNHAKFTEALPKSAIIDVSTEVMWSRIIKSEEEIELIRNGARISEIGGAAAVEAVGVGVPEYEVAIAGTSRMIREIAKTYPHAELMDTWTWCQSGINSDGGHNPLTTRKTEAGDLISISTFPMIAGYYTALERTFFLDHVPSDRAMEIWEINCKVHRKGLELIKPGARCCDIAKELNEIFLEHDLLQFRNFGYGHSFGVLNHYYGREAGLELREDIETVLEPNMVVSMEPMVVIPETFAAPGGYKEHDILIVKEDGAENITKFPFGPEHNIIKV